MAIASRIPKDYNWYIYKPVHGASIAFAVLFFISGCFHVWQNNLKYRSYRIGFLLPWAAAIFVAGFVLREYGSYHTNDLGVFISGSTLLFVAPPVYNAANYFIFGRALYYLPYLSPIHPGRVWSTFVALDLVADVIAANGVVRAVNSGLSASERNVGMIMVKFSLFMLISMFLGFMFLNVQFHFRAIRHGVFTHRIKVVMYVLYTSNILILLRNAFRTATVFYSFDSVANGKEWPFWVFEIIPMLANTYLLNILPPAKYMPTNHKIYLAIDGITEIEGPGLVDKRPFILTVIDPFDIVGIVKKKDRKNRYWLQDGVGGPKKDHSSSLTDEEAIRRERET